MKDALVSFRARVVFGLLALLLGGGAYGCGSASRAVVHKDDYSKVFPWPRNQASVIIRVKPQTGSAKVFVWSGDWENVEVNQETTFYITEDTGEKFAYTPSRSPIRRLAPVDSMEIRWPLSQPAAEPPGEKPPEPQGQKPAQTTRQDPASAAPAPSGGEAQKK